MVDLDFLVPSALVDPALAIDLLRSHDDAHDGAHALPQLARLLARSGPTTSIALPPHASPTAWQAWVFGERGGVAIDRINVGELWAMACGIAPSTTGGRYVAEPAHFTIANDHLRLDDPRALDVTLAEVRALADAIRPVLVDAGWRLDPLEPATRTHWMMRRDDAHALSAPAIDRAIGDNVAAWQPRSADDAQTDAGLAWRRVVNEVQMLWFGHPVNEARDADGRATINTLWLSGNGAPMSALPRYAVVDSSLPLLAALPVEPDAPRALESFDGFVDPARRDDWSGWREQLAAFDARIGDALRRQAEGAIGVVTLVLCGRELVKTATVARGGWWQGLLPRLGRRPSLADCFAEGAVA